MPFKFVSIPSTVAFNKDAFPNRRRSLPAGPNHSACQNKPIYCVDVCCVDIQAQYQAFVRFAVGSSTALAIALDWTCVLEPFNRAGSRFENSGLHPYTYGASSPGPMLWAERSRSRGIFQAVFLRSNRTLSRQFAARDGPFNSRQIGFGGVCSG